MKSVLLTILDVSSVTGIGKNRVGSALFMYLMEMVGPAFLSQIVTDNGSDAWRLSVAYFSS